MAEGEPVGILVGEGVMDGLHGPVDGRGICPPPISLKRRFINSIRKRTISCIKFPSKPVSGFVCLFLSVCTLTVCGWQGATVGVPAGRLGCGVIDPAGLDGLIIPVVDGLMPGVVGFVGQTEPLALPKQVNVGTIDVGATAPKLTR